MFKLSFTLSILVLPLTLNSIQAQVAGTKAGTSSVSGRVTLKGEPARGVTLILQVQDNPGASNFPRVRTDESGRFQFTSVAAGRYTVSALAPGYVSTGEVMIGFRGQTLNVNEGEKVENIDIEIKRGGVIAGRITDSQNRPVIEETINLIRLDRNNRPQNYFAFSPNFDMYRTDDRGFYRIYGLPEGRFLVSVGYAQNAGGTRITLKSREFYQRVFYPNTTSESEAKVIEVSEGSEATEVDIALPDPKQTHDIYGKVVDAGAGQPVMGVEIVVGGLTPDGRPTGGYFGAGVRSGLNGEFRVYGVIPGKYAIHARNDSPNSGGYVSDPVTLDISEGDVTGVEVKVRQGASISGVAIFEGTNDPKTLAKLSQINISAFVRPMTPGTAPPAPMGIRPVRVNPDGSFRINGLQSGKAMIMTQPLPDMRGLTIGRIEVNGAPAPDGIELDPGEQVAGVRVFLIFGTLTLSGEAKIVGGAFPAGLRFRVIARKVDQQMQNTPTAEIDALGRFVIENLTPGEYEIRVSPFFTPNSEQLDRELMGRLAAFKERVVVAGGNQQPITLVIDLSRKEENR